MFELELLVWFLYSVFCKEYSELYTSTKSTDLLLCLVSVRGTGLLLLFSLFHELHRRIIVLKLLLNFSVANWGISDSGIRDFMDAWRRRWLWTVSVDLAAWPNWLPFIIQRQDLCTRRVQQMLFTCTLIRLLKLSSTVFLYQDAGTLWSGWGNIDWMAGV